MLKGKGCYIVFVSNTFLRARGLQQAEALELQGGRCVCLGFFFS